MNAGVPASPPRPPLTGLRLLAIDVGSRRIGVALSDHSGMLASPLVTLEARGPGADAAALATLCSEHDAEGVIVGLPAHADGSESSSAKRARKYADALERVGLRVDFQDEWGSSVDAKERLVDQGVDMRTAPKGTLDRAAAAVILQAYLDARGRK